MWFQAYLNVIMSERASDIDKFENFKCMPKYPKFQLSGCLFWTKQKAQASFFRIYNVFKMYTGLVLHSKKRKWDLPFWFIKQGLQA